MFFPDPNTDIHNLVFVQYLFDVEEHEVKIKPHGNAKNLSLECYRTSLFKSTEEKKTILDHPRKCVQQVKNIKKRFPKNRV